MKPSSRTFFALTAITLCALSSTAYADSARDKEIAERFAKCDKNHDDKLTAEEAKGCMPRVYDHFSYIDSSGKGYVTIAQIQTLANN
jgi:hypothetical protein